MSGPVLIFGATGGIGSALARRLARDGTGLFLSARDAARLSALGDELGAPTHPADVRDPEAIDEVVRRAAAGGVLGGLVYSVGSIVLRPLKAATAEAFHEAYALNVVGAALAVRAAAPALVAGKGAVVLFSSVAVQQGFVNHSVISAAKGGVEGLARALAAELAPDVRVNVVAPSLTRTPLAGPLMANEAMVRGISAMHAIPRLGEPDDIAAAAAYLVGPDSAWVTGQVLGVDGGRGHVRTRG